jgi:tetratricopeptide (TPR) repeat protein
MADRLEALKNLLALNPNDVFARYGLAMTYASQGQFEQAFQEFETLLALDPDYSVAYFQAGQALEKLGRLEEARQMYQRGIQVTTRLGQSHARDQLQDALDLLG